MKTVTPTWKPVSRKWTQKYVDYTLVRVKGWNRFGFARWDDEWILKDIDPAIYTSGRDAKVTHWLAIAP